MQQSCNKLRVIRYKLQHTNTVEGFYNAGISNKVFALILPVHTVYIFSEALFLAAAVHSSWQETKLEGPLYF